MGWLRRRIKARLTGFILDIIFSEIQVGGHCGCCGTWVSHHLVWAGDGITLCDDCLATEPDSWEEE